MTHWGQHSQGTAGSSDSTGASGQTVGFRYFMGMHMGICRGPINELNEIRVGDRTAWQGTASLNQAIDIDAYDLFGGEGGEGGVKGTFTLMMGASDQVCPDALANLLDNIIVTNGTVSADTIAIDNQTITGVHGDDYVGIKLTDNGFAYATFSSKPDEPLDRPWNLGAPLYGQATGRGGILSPSMGWQIRFHLDAGDTIPFVDGLGMQLDLFYNMGVPAREFRCLGGTAKFLITIETTSGVVVDTSAVTLVLV